jgi:hypothetical protein
MTPSQFEELYHNVKPKLVLYEDVNPVAKAIANVGKTATHIGIGYDPPRPSGFKSRGATVYNAVLQYFAPEVGPLAPNVRSFLQSCKEAAKVHIYINNSATFKQKHPNNAPNTREWSALMGSMRKEAGGRNVNLYKKQGLSIKLAFFGKGSPWDYSLALGLAIRYGRLRSSTLQRYCDKIARLGLDCSGFVGQYFNYMGKFTQEDVRKYSAARWANRPKNKVRKTINEIKSTDVLIWTGKGHVALVDKVLGNGKFRIVESCYSGGGLRKSEHDIELKTSNKKTVKKESKEVFRIKVRAGRPGKKRDEVWIAGF